MENNKILSLIGFSKRAGKLCSGMNQVHRAILNKKAKLVIVACDVAENTKSKLEYASKDFGIRLITFSSIEELSKITGETNKGTYAILDTKFSEPIIKLVDDILNQMEEY